MATTEVETWTCEFCSKEVLLNDAIYSEGCHYCPECWARWQATFDACQHDFEPAHDEYGDPGRYCRRCAGFVGDDERTKAP